VYHRLGLSCKKQRPEAGLTTLEWLLIVAAVAGLAALAVVLVQNVVDDTAEQISGSNARITAAEVAAAQITSDARSDLPPNGSDATWATPTELRNRQSEQQDVNSEYSSKCNRLSITYSDAGVNANWNEIAVASGSAATARGSRSDTDSRGSAWGDQVEASCEISS